MVVGWITIVRSSPSGLRKQPQQISTFPDSIASVGEGTSNNMTSCSYAPRDCSNNGECSLDGSGCSCHAGFVTYACAPNVGCCYKQKKQTTAFLLSLFLGGVAADRFYLGQVLIPIMKLMLCTGFPLLWGCCLCLVASSEKEKADPDDYARMSKYGMSVCTCALAIWIIVDLVFIGMCRGAGQTLDGNGQMMYCDM